MEYTVVNVVGYRGRRSLDFVKLGLKISATVVLPGELDDLTEIHTSPKSKRFRDERPPVKA